MEPELTQSQTIAFPQIGPMPVADMSAAQRVLAFATSVSVATVTERDLAVEEVRGIKARREALEEKRKSIVGPMNEAVKRVNDLFRQPIANLDEAERLIKKTVTDFDIERERIADEARRKAAAEVERIRQEAERKARAEREKAEAEARRKREEEERARKAADDAARQAREAREAESRAKNEGERNRLRLIAEEQERARKVAEEEERKAREAAMKVEQRGEERAQAALAAVDEAPQPHIPGAAKAQGTSRLITWTAEVFDLKKLVDAVAAGRVPLSSVMPDPKVLNKAAASQQREMENFYPGVRAIEKRGLAVGK